MYKLGAQGLAVQKQLQQRAQNQTQTQTITIPNLSEPAPQSQQQQEVESLIHLLKSNNVNIKKKDLLSYCVNYFPKVRNVDNLRLITALFFNNTVLFEHNTSTSRPTQFEEENIMTEAIHYMFQTKLRISEPTIGKELFFSTFLTELYDNKTIQPIQKIAVLTGVLMTKPLAELVQTPETQRFYQDSYYSVGCLISELVSVVVKQIHLMSDDVVRLIVLSSALSLPYLSPNALKASPHEILCQLAMSIFLTPASSLPKPVWDNLNKVSFLIESTILSNTVRYEILASQLQKLIQFAQHLNQSKTNIASEDLKTYYFGIISVFQGVVKLNLNAYCKLSLSQIYTNCLNILQTLNELNFILIQLGSSGFKAYDFVFLNAINGGLELNQSQFEKDVEQLHSQNLRSAESEKIMFSLALFEHITKYCSTKYFEHAILPTLETYLLGKPQQELTSNPLHHKLLLESAHQVIISNLSHLHSLKINHVAYLRIVVDQYQHQLLKLNQLLIITRQVTTHSSNSDEILNCLLHAIFLAILNTKMYPSHHEEKEEINQYPRLGLLKSLITTIPSLQNLHTLRNWLENISELIQPLPLSFKTQLNDFVWSVISNELNLTQVDVAIEWWYSERDHSKSLAQGRDARL
ncbi:hypothetical protein WICPIJ_006168 [Wickerhamomyces pijperi]|uniref:Uncharacterized protein n=1 Tax=Wickerhamomyces pijperi TaxID=599730 RepID=A0A9P8TL46_WICPI|nr:hypothetical protein WICPIJ_006168 [Wickerhamomyces pijperi]